MKVDNIFAPPDHPPPLLSHEQLSFLSFQGWLPLRLPDGVQSAATEVFADAKDFFATDEAHKRNLYPANGGTDYGFYVVPDEKEYLTLRHQTNPNLALEQHVRILWTRVARLLYRILVDLFVFHGLGPRICDDLVEGALDMPRDRPGAANNPTQMRLFRYFPNGLAEQHTDLGLLTLCITDGEGLEVLDQIEHPPQWISAPRFVVLVGALGSRIFEGGVRAGSHRVISNPKGRRSIVFALRPSLESEHMIRDGDQTHSIRNVWNSIKSSKFNVNAERHAREAQRETVKVASLCSVAEQDTVRCCMGTGGDMLSKKAASPCLGII